LQGIPCVYYGTEQGLHGDAGTDASVRESLWGKPGIPFDKGAPFYTQIQKIARVRSLQPALRYGRQYVRPISGDGNSFRVSRFMPGVLAFSRILVDDEVVVVANASEQPGVPPLSAIVDANLNPIGSAFQVLYSNKPNSTPPGQVQEFGRTRPVSVLEVDGSVSHGPLNAFTVTLQPLEIQILGRAPA
jgi:glycosidase